MKRFKSFLTEQRDLIISFHHSTSVQQISALSKRINEIEGISSIEKQEDGYHIIGTSVILERQNIIDMVLEKDTKAKFRMV